MKVKSSKTGAFVFGRIDDCDEFCYNAYISISFGFSQKQFNRSFTVSFAFLADGTFFVFRPYFGTKQAVLLGCLFLLYTRIMIQEEMFAFLSGEYRDTGQVSCTDIKAVNPSKK